MCWVIIIFSFFSKKGKGKKWHKKYSFLPISQENGGNSAESLQIPDYPARGNEPEYKAMYLDDECLRTNEIAAVGHSLDDYSWLSQALPEKDNGNNLKEYRLYLFLFSKLCAQCERSQTVKENTVRKPAALEAPLLSVLLTSDDVIYLKCFFIILGKLTVTQEN